MKCRKQDCLNEISGAGPYCYDCYNSYKSESRLAPKLWDDDKIVDQLMKINANIGNMNKIFDSTESNLDCIAQNITNMEIQLQRTNDLLARLIETLQTKR
jgi:hypothetical protein